MVPVVVDNSGVPTVDPPPDMAAEAPKLLTDDGSRLPALPPPFPPAAATPAGFPDDAL